MIHIPKSTVFHLSRYTLLISCDLFFSSSDIHKEMPFSVHYYNSVMKGIDIMNTMLYIRIYNKKIISLQSNGSGKSKRHFFDFKFFTLFWDFSKILQKSTNFDFPEKLQEVLVNIEVCTVICILKKIVIKNKKWVLTNVDVQGYVGNSMNWYDAIHFLQFVTVWVYIYCNYFLKIF